MNRTGIIVLVLIAAVWLLATPAVAEEGKVPDWAEPIKLVMFGGPSPGDLEVSLNGDFVVEILGVTPPVAEISDLLQAGVNRLKITMKPPEEPRRANILKVQVAPVEQLGAMQQQTLMPLAQFVVPPELLGGAEECTEEISFWGGPPPYPEADLKERYYLVVQGPPIPHFVTIWINDLPLFASAGGETFMEITQYVLKGRNEVRYEFKPTCMTRESKREGMFTIMVATGEEDLDVVQMDNPQAYMQHIVGTKKGKTFTRKYSFRGR
jgi:hypothetical protein